MLRRTLLKLAALTGLSAALPRPARASSPAAPPARVVVVGAGPAGISAALELAERGVAVTLIEADAQVGGKVKGWTETLGAEAVDVEHGVHGWWHQYVHFKDLLRRADLHHRLNERDPKGTYRWAGGEMNANTRRGFRAFVGRFRAESKNLGYERFQRDLRAGLKYLQSLEPAVARATLGGRSVAQWHKDGAPLTLWRVFAEETSHSMYFVPPEQLDAAEFALGERFYFAESRDTVSVQWLRGNPQTELWEPLIARFKSLGGQVRLNARVSEVEVVDGRAVGVHLGKPSPGVHVAELPFGWTELPREGGEGSIFVRRDQDDRLTALSGRCTHAGCPLTLTPGEGFTCPCHGGRFDEEGQPLAGPPETPLRRLWADWGGDGVTIEGEPSAEFVPAEWVILALDAPGLRAVAGDILPAVKRLRTVPATVARFWLDRDLPEELGHAVIFTELPHISNGFLLHRLQDKARAWAEARGGGAVIELQAYKNMDPTLSREATLDLIEADLRAAWPELQGAQVLKRTLTVSNTFTSFHPGWHEGSLPVITTVPGLLLAGVHVTTDRVCAFMEKAVFTGRLAANEVLGALGLPMAKVLPSA